MAAAVALMQALSGVRDPELDEPITDLGFVSELCVDGPRVHVRLRLPTYFCAPNFAYLMAADAQEALAAVDGVQEVQVTLEDHFASGEINGGVAARHDFAGTFPGLADDGDLGELRTLFDRKAFLVRQERLARMLLGDGREPSELASMYLRDLPDVPETGAYLQRRARLGLDVSGDAPLLLRPNGERIAPGDAERQLRFARTVRVSVEGNAELCRGLLQTRYGPQEHDDQEQEVPT
jgi:metal-sulfur cluster biosynthetic enzyme